MGYELVMDMKGGWIEIEADSAAELEKRIAAVDLPRLERLIAEARKGGKPAAKAKAKRPAKKGASKKRRAR